MTHYVTGTAIKALREKKGYTQKQLADFLNVSDKTVSKWENQKGLPDISLLEPLAHPMEKNHYISFFAYATSDRITFKKLYPEGNPETRFPVMGHGQLYAYCNRHGLFKIRI